jgi:hypothetical protein
MRDIGTGNMAVIENTRTKINKIFPLIAAGDNDWKSIILEKERKIYLTILTSLLCGLSNFQC